MTKLYDVPVGNADIYVGDPVIEPNVTMIERVARAICPNKTKPSLCLACDGSEVCLGRATASQARAAIEAMREPSAAIERAGYDALNKGDRVWYAMIDEILKESPCPPT